MIRLSPPTLERFISGGWGASRSYRGGWHEGLDFPSPNGSPVLAAADGLVIRAKNYSDSYAGKWIGIDHGNGIRTRYLHNTKNLVSKGDRVTRGQQIATVGQTGTSGRSTPHVHFDVKLLAAAHEAYTQRYGTPATGWGSSMTIGRGVPGETFMSGASYRPGARDAAVAKGVVFYKSSGGILLLGAAAGYWWLNH